MKTTLIQPACRSCKQLLDAMERMAESYNELMYEVQQLRQRCDEQEMELNSTTKAFLEKEQQLKRIEMIAQRLAGQEQ